MLVCIQGLRNQYKMKQSNLEAPLLEEESEMYETVKKPKANESESDDEEAENNRRELDHLKKEIKQKREVRRANQKVFVGTGFGFDITEFFTFKKKKQIQSGGDAKSIFEEISGGHLSFFILIYSVCNAAMIPPWIMNIEANKLLRISWRFVLQALMIIPFVLYEKRTANPETLEKYKLEHIFTIAHLKKAYISAFSTSFWFTIILTTFEWTYISHAMFLGSMANFFLSIGRTTRGNGHDLEPGGQLLILMGVILVLIDTWTLRVDAVDPRAYNFINYFYLERERAQRIAADLIALAVSFCMSKLSVFTADLRTFYPPYLSMLLVNSMVSINMAFSAFFFNGATFDYDPKYGIFSILSQKHFAGFLYMSIILCMGLIISFVLVSKLFPNPIVPSLVMTFEPGMSTLILEIAGVQVLPGSFAFIGYIFIIPGTFLILIGQWMFQREQKKEEVQEKQRLTELIISARERESSLHRSIKHPSNSLVDYEMQVISPRSSEMEGSAKNLVLKSVKRPQTLQEFQLYEDSPIFPDINMKKKSVSFKEIDISEYRDAKAEGEDEEKAEGDGEAQQIYPNTAPRQ